MGPLSVRVAFGGELRCRPLCALWLCAVRWGTACLELTCLRLSLSEKHKIARDAATERCKMEKREQLRARVHILWVWPHWRVLYKQHARLMPWTCASRF